MQFTLFLLVNAVLLIRPAEVVPALENLPIYNVLMLTCLIVSLPKIVRQLTVENLVEHPINLCVVGIFTTIVLSQLSRLQLTAAMVGAVEFAKVLLYYFLLVSVVDTPTRLRRFLWLLAGATIVLTSLALLQYYGAIDIPSLRPVYDRDGDEASGSPSYVLRLCGTGIYHDPNDLCLVLLMSMGICLYGLGDLKKGLSRFCWLAPLIVFGFALTRTHSRGGFLAMLVALVVLLIGRLGRRKALPLLLVVLPVIFLIFAGRQTKITTFSGTGQNRIQLWSEGIVLFRQSPIFGIGQHRYVEEVGLVAHNSYLHGFTELGFFGGTLFAGAFYYALATMSVLGKWESYIPDPEMRRLRPYLLAIVASYAVGLMTLSRNYIVPTYMILGLVTVYLREATQGSPLRPFPVGFALACRFSLCAATFLVLMYVYVRTFARFGG